MIDVYEGDIGWFVDRFHRNMEIRSLTKEVELASTIAIATSAGNSKEANAAFSKWNMKKITQIEDLRKQETETVFEKLKREKGRKTNTLFDRLKRQ